MILSPTFSLSEYANRRAQLFQSMPDNSVLVVAAGIEVTRSQDTEFRFCQDKYFQYLTGFPEPDAVLVMSNRDGQKSLLFCRPKDEEMEIWHGLRIGPDKAATSFGLDESYSLESLDEQLEALLNGSEALLMAEGVSQSLESRIADIIRSIRSLKKRGAKPPQQTIDITDKLDSMRLVKSESELNLMRKANQISGEAHCKAMKLSKQGVMEYQLEAEILHHFMFNGARSEAYSTIVGSGDNATILHYTDNDQALADGDLVLIDAGAELEGYAADITRTFPVTGVYSEEQSAIYDLVLSAQIAAIDAIKPGKTFAELNDLVNEIMTKGLLELGILSGDLTQLIEDKAIKKYFMHGLGHWLGLDVHDVGDYEVDENRRQLKLFEPGMVMTIEPGLYFSPKDDSIDQKWRGIGVRIEDNVLVTAAGHENLTTNVPKTREEIEELMAR